MKFSFQWVPEKAKGTRWFVKYGATTKYNRGFKTKDQAREWIDALEGIDWRVGFLFRLRGDDYNVEVVDRMGRSA